MPTSSSRTMPKSVRQKAEEAIAAFNASELKDSPVHYVPRFRGRFLYLDRSDDGDPPDPVARLTYTGSMTDWKFAIYRFSNERYDPDEWLFPGQERVDGTLEGAMRAGLDAYPASPGDAR